VVGFDERVGRAFTSEAEVLQDGKHKPLFAARRRVGTLAAQTSISRSFEREDRRETTVHTHVRQRAIGRRA
jgi:hypothetical protein